MSEQKVKRNYKDSLFRFICTAPEFREHMLSLYNFLNRSDYTDPEMLEMISTEKALFVSVKNDVAFLIADVIFFMEHQSTWSPNMPFRFLEYYMESLRIYISEHRLRMNARTLQKIPAAQFYVMYNGVREVQESLEISLSDMFLNRDKSDIDLTVHVLNINYGKNRELMDSCRLLYEYAWMMDRVRKGTAEKGVERLREVTDGVLREMPEEFILKRFLLEHGEEVMEMFLSNVTPESLRQDGYEEGFADGESSGEKKGRAEGHAEGRAEGRAEGQAEGRAVILVRLHEHNLAKGMTSEESVREIAEMLHMTEEEILSGLNHTQD